jgi:hypothetical protein
MIFRVRRDSVHVLNNLLGGDENDLPCSRTNEAEACCQSSEILGLRRCVCKSCANDGGIFNF